MQSAWKAPWLFNQLVVEICKALCLIFPDKEWTENPLDAHSDFPEQYSKRRDGHLAEHLALGKPSSSSGAAVASNTSAYATAWQATHRHAKYVRPVSVKDVQQVILSKYFGEGTNGHFAQVVKFNCASDGTRLATKDVLMFLFAARHPDTAMVKSMWGPHQVDFGCSE